jgi:hypothetical protein
MYIKRNRDGHTNYIEMNDVEYKVFKKIYSTLIVNPEGVSNQFILTKEEADIARKMGAYMHVIR